MAVWIGGMFCAGDGPWTKELFDASRELGTYDIEEIRRQRPQLREKRWGIKRRLPHLMASGRGIMRKGDGRAYLVALSDRFRTVRVCCGSWERIVGPSVTWAGEDGTKQATCGVFLDPPYSLEAGRDNNTYRLDNTSVAHDVREWCRANGDNRRLRIALCGYAGEGHDVLADHGWSVVAWQTHGGYGVTQNITRALAEKAPGPGATNRTRERIWFSPGCLSAQQPDLFGG